jgi:16S rRNA (guanine527-N7)-methyltransferase
LRFASCIDFELPSRKDHRVEELSNDTLEAALSRHEIELPDDQRQKLDAFCRVLWDWNSRLNLTRHTTYEKFVTRDVVDSLALAAQLEPDEKILDVGTGGGVPGIVLAIVRPDLEVALCDSVAKKAKAVAAIVDELRLPVIVFHAPAQSLVEPHRFDVLVIRAVASLTKLLTWFAPHWSSIGRILVIKGPRWAEERGEARHRGLMNDLELRKVASYQTAGNDGESVVLRIQPKVGA